MTFEFVVWADTQSGDAYHIEALSYEGNATSLNSPPYGAGEFVIISDETQELEWFGQIIEPQRNLPLQGLTRDNPSNIAAMEKVLKGEVRASIFLRQVYYYKIRLLGEIHRETGRLRSVTRRPRAGSCGRAAAWDEVIRYMDLPARDEREIDGITAYNNVLGCVHSLDIPVTIDDVSLYQHVLVAGATGSGKSNSVANLIKAAQVYGMCVIVFDHKPDYQDVEAPSDEPWLFNRFQGVGLQPFGLTQASYFTLFSRQQDDHRADEYPIAVRASDIPLGMLAAGMFYRSGEELQQEVFSVLLRTFAEERGSNPWTIDDFLAWYRDLKTTQIANLFGGKLPHESTLGAITYKLKQRQPDWMDAYESQQGGYSPGRGGLLSGQPSRVKSSPRSYFQPREFIAPGQVLVIRVDAEGREYGLFLSYMLREVFDARRKGEIDAPILNIIDEAQDIFQGSHAVQQSATAAVNEIVRKGRSKQIGFVFAVQSGSQLPTALANNMNSRIIHRQNTEQELRNAIPGAPRELLQSALSFGPGEALVSILGARGVLHADMSPSPFKLTKFAPVVRRTLGDQLEDGELDLDYSASPDLEDELPF